MLKSNNLRAKRKAAFLSQEELAEKAKVTRQTIISIESNKYTPSLELALRIAKIFKCKVEDLFNI